MAQSIYLLKIHLLLALFSMSPEETRIAYRMANFIALFYSKLFLRSRISVFAPTDDLQFLSAMHWYKQEDMVIANAVIPSIHRHLWYLTEQLIVFALFYESLSNFTRGLMAKKLFSIQDILHFN